MTTPRRGRVCDWLGGGQATPTAACRSRSRCRIPPPPHRSGLGGTALGVAADHRGGGRDRPPGRRRTTTRWPAIPGWPGRRSSCLQRGPRTRPGALRDGARVRRPVARRGCAGLPEAPSSSRRCTHVPADGLLHVAGGADDEFMRPLDFAPFPGGPARSLFAPGWWRRSSSGSPRASSPTAGGPSTSPTFSRGHPRVARPPHGPGPGSCCAPTTPLRGRALRRAAARDQEVGLRRERPQVPRRQQQVRVHPRPAASARKSSKA